MTTPLRDTKHQSSADTSLPPQLRASTSTSCRPALCTVSDDPSLRSPGTRNIRARTRRPGPDLCRTQSCQAAPTAAIITVTPTATLISLTPQNLHLILALGTDSPSDPVRRRVCDIYVGPTCSRW